MEFVVEIDYFSSPFPPPLDYGIIAKLQFRDIFGKEMVIWSIRSQRLTVVIMEAKYYSINS